MRKAGNIWNRSVTKLFSIVLLTIAMVVSCLSFNGLIVQAAGSWDFSYKGYVQAWECPETGYYQLETWGAGGGTYSGTNLSGTAGKGGYATGIAYLTRGQILYIVVGGSGTVKYGGYNGGGNSYYNGGGGGGATHIGIYNALLSSYGSTNGLYIVAGAGGGAGCHDHWDSWGWKPEYNGGGAGGCLNGSNSSGGDYGGKGGSQYGGGAGGDANDGSAGGSGSFGKGGNGAGGGGAGFYGGGGGGDDVDGDGDWEDDYGGGGGSSYLGGVSQGYSIMGIQSGNGYARITSVADNRVITRTGTTVTEYDWVCPETGWYKLQVEGGKAGNSTFSSCHMHHVGDHGAWGCTDHTVVWGIGGDGGRAYGEKYLTAGTIIHVKVGKQGANDDGGISDGSEVYWADGENGGKSEMTVNGVCTLIGYGGTGGESRCDPDGYDYDHDGEPGSAYANGVVNSRLQSGVVSGGGSFLIEVRHVHEYTSKITTQPTCTTKGVRTYTCTGTPSDPGCNHQYTEDVSALGHLSPQDYSYTVDNGIANGLAYKNCMRANCGVRLDSKWLNRIRVRYQNADGTYGSYSNVVNDYYYSGNLISWGLPSGDAYKYYQYTSTSWVSAASAKSVDVTVYRNVYKLTLNKGTGISAVSGAGNKLHDALVSIDATVKTGYTFKNWTGTFTANDKNYKFHMPGNEVVLTANARPNLYTIRFDKNKPTKASNDVRGSMPDQKNLSWTNTYTLNSNNYTLTGWTFQGWSLNSGDSNSVNYYNSQNICNETDSSLPDSPDGVIVTLYAVWKENAYNIVFDGNNDTGYVSGSTSAIYNIPYEDTVSLSENGFTRTSPVNMEYKDGDWQSVNSIFLGWNYDVSDGQHIVFTDGQSVKQLSARDGSTVLLHAVWDDNPTFNIGNSHDPIDGNPNYNFSIEFPDRYFTLEEAQNGMITADVLMQEITAYDREDDLYQIELVGFNASDYTSLTSSTVTTQTYKVTDSAGRHSYLTVNVYVIENNVIKQSVGNIYRSYDDNYYMNNDGYFVSITDGGLYSNSNWIVSDTQRQALEQIILRRGDESNSIYSFSSENIADIRDYVINHGIGTGASNNLAQVYLLYIRDNLKTD